MESGNVPIKAGPVPDRVAIWPLESGRYGLDATFQGASGYDRADWHVVALDSAQVRYSFRQELDGGWTLRFGDLTAADVSRAIAAFVQ